MFTFKFNLILDFSVREMFISVISSEKINARCLESERFTALCHTSGHRFATPFWFNGTVGIIGLTRSSSALHFSSEKWYILLYIFIGTQLPPFSSLTISFMLSIISSGPCLDEAMKLNGFRAFALVTLISFKARNSDCDFLSM